MVYDEDLLARLEDAPRGGRSEEVFRHMFGDFSPFLANTSGARWNPAEVAAIYTSIDRLAAIAEADHRIGLEPFRLKAKRVLYTLRIELANVLDLSTGDYLAQLGVDDAALEDLTFAVCEVVGGAVAWLGHDGLLVPSARHDGLNLVIFPTNMSPHAVFEIVGQEELLYPDEPEEINR